MCVTYWSTQCDDVITHTWRIFLCQRFIGSDKTKARRRLCVVVDTAVVAALLGMATLLLQPPAKWHWNKVFFAYFNTYTKPAGNARDVGTLGHVPQVWIARQPTGQSSVLYMYIVNKNITFTGYPRHFSEIFFPASENLKANFLCAHVVSKPEEFSQKHV